MAFPTGLVLFLATAQHVSAQVSTGSSGTSLIGSIGIGGGPLGLAGLASLGVATPAGEFYVRAAGLDDLEDLKLSKQGAHNASADVAVLYGLSLTLGSRARLRLAGGPAFVHTVGQWGFNDCLSAQECTYEEGSASTAGVAIQLDAVWMNKWHAVGLGLFGNRNGDRSFWGVTIGLQFGGAH